MASNLKFIEETCREKGWKYIRKDDKHIYIEHNGFTFKPNRTNFPPIKLNPSKCTTPTEYARYLLSLKFRECDFRRFSYVNNSSKSEVVCKKHGSYFISYNQLMMGKGNGCNLCKSEITSVLNSKNKITTVDWLKNFNRLHGDKYDYSKISGEINSLSTIDIICSEHGVFQQQVYVHNRGSGCKKCVFEKVIGFSRSNYIDFCRSGSNLYFFELSDGSEKFLKIGISKDVNSRIKCIRRESGYECLRSHTYFNEDAGKIYDLEKMLHKKFRKLSYTPLRDFRGSSECFSIDFDFLVGYYNSNF